MAEVGWSLFLYKELGSAMKVSRETGFPRRNISAWVVADKRSRMSLEDACADMIAQECRSYSKDHPGVTAKAKRWANKLRMHTEIAKEAYRLHKRLGTSLPKCIMQCAANRGMSGNAICCAVSAGKIPEHWLQ